MVTNATIDAKTCTSTARLRILPVTSVLGTDTARRRCRRHPRRAGRPPPRAPTCTHNARCAVHGQSCVARPSGAREHLGIGWALGSTQRCVRAGCRRSLDACGDESRRWQLICLLGRLRGTHGEQSAERVSTSVGRATSSHLPRVNSPVPADEQRLSEAPVHKWQQHL